MTRTLLLVLASLPVLGTTACGVPDPVGSDDVVTYVATDVAWLDGEDPIDEVIVRVGGGRVEVRAGCNSLGVGGARVDGGRLTGGTVSTTDMGCGSDVASRQDDWLGELVAAEPEITVTADRVELGSRDAELVAVRQD
ncbi:MAG: META domain-containing protein [Nocardioides sp.]|uniref:META domain-containing protein n=1 Tax=Nocardioides sp. TaxID=35761 RepID=UPI00238DED87|nr:META domain-containing protein [Nocardioides sp.]MDE0775482.1 META domain-containing protein [Nocardioides sp.]